MSNIRSTWLHEYLSIYNATILSSLNFNIFLYIYIKIYLNTCSIYTRKRFALHMNGSVVQNKVKSPIGTFFLQLNTCHFFFFYADFRLKNCVLERARWICASQIDFTKKYHKSFFSRIHFSNNNENTSVVY